MLFFVHGRDVPGFDWDSDELNEAHWSYMDKWAGALIARGPTLSVDGSMHTGSVHIIDLCDGAAARRFAFEEPYYLAGLYEEVTVQPFASSLDGTMWDRPSATADQPATLLLATWTEVAFEPDIAEELRNAFASAEAGPWIFAGALLSDDSTTVRGLAAAVDLGPSEAEGLLRAAIAQVLASPGEVHWHCWARGGRPTE
ncbi:MAG: YciI family protein [Jatrophihabitans sp.]